MVLQYQDIFDRPDSADVGPNFDAGYTAQNAAKIVSQAVLATTLGTNSTEACNVALSNDQWAEMVIKAHSGAADQVWLVLGLRMAAAPTLTLYQFCATRNTGGNTSMIFSVVAGTPTALVTDTTVTWGVGDILRAEAQGTALRLYRRPVGSSVYTLICSITDSTIPTGSRAGFQIFVGTLLALTDAQFSSFKAGDLRGAGVSTGLSSGGELTRY